MIFSEIFSYGVTMANKRPSFVVGDCRDSSQFERGYFNGVLTSPPYNLGRNPRHRSENSDDSQLYSVFTDDMSSIDYTNQISQLFLEFERIVQDDGVILWNMGMSTKGEGPLLPMRTITAIADNTDWHKE